MADDAPRSPDQQLKWKEETDQALGQVQLDMKKIPAKLVLPASSVGEQRVADLRAVAEVLEQQAQQLSANGATPFTSQNALNRLLGIVDLEMIGDNLNFRLSLRAGEAAQQAKHMELIRDGLRAHAGALEAELAGGSSPQQPPQGQLLTAR